MRLYLLPISTRRTLIYCQRLNVSSIETQTWLDKGTTKAAALWAGWEKKESGWKKKTVDYGNYALKRIPYEEWGLKSVPPLSARRKMRELAVGEGGVEVSFPKGLIPMEKVKDVLKSLGTERQGLHKMRMLWSFVGMPISAPFALVPIIPNLPFFYLVFRAWSHWRALSGSKHIEFLLDNNLINFKSSKVLDELYSTGKHPFDASKSVVYAATEERMVLHESDGRRIAEALEIPELRIELDRAVWQVEKALETEEERKEQETKARKDKAKSEDEKN